VTALANPPARSALSPRRRRLRLAIIILICVSVVGMLAGVLVHLLSRPAQYRPGESHRDVTRQLSRNLPPEAPQPRFSDVTQAAGLAAFRNFAGARTSQLPEDMGPGVAWGDFDNDGDDDLFLVSAGGALDLPPDRLLPCELYENLGDNTFRRFADFPETRIHGLGAAWGDYNNDGWLDLMVSGYDTLRLFRNEPAPDGRRHFIRDPSFPDPKGFWAGIAWGDYDQDRNLDLYVCGYVQYVVSDADLQRGSQQLSEFVPFTLNPASFQPGLNLLFHNNGDGTFTEVAQALGVTNPTGRSLGALWHDFDDDGWPELYVANDISDNAFYHNRHGTFADLSHAAWVADYRSAMGLAAGDYDRDGDDDLFITHWVAQENALYDNQWMNFLKAAATNRSKFLDPASTNYALRFVDVNEWRGVGQLALPFVGWGTEFVDFDDDGWLDLIVVNGNTIEAEGPRPKKLQAQESFLFWNQHGTFFHNLAPLSSLLSEKHVSRGLAVADYDNDGDLDVVVAQLGEGVQLLRNEMQIGHWLKLRLRSRVPSGARLGFGDGTRVIAHLGEVALRRSVSGVSYLSQSSHTLHFGLGQARLVDWLEVRWSAGETSYFTNLQADATWEIGEGESQPKRVPSTGAPQLHSGSPTKVTPDAAAGSADRAKLVEFWNRQRAAMDAMKLEGNDAKAIRLFRAALELNPDHEDSRYYLGNCLARQGDVNGALVQLQELIRINPSSHRGLQQCGTLRAIFATNDADLVAAEQFLEKAHALNPEETGALLVLGEIALLRQDSTKAEERLSAACRTNPRATGGFFLRGYLAWKSGEAGRASTLLAEARETLGKDWQPKGATAEGDVRRKQHLATTPLSRFWENWDGHSAPESAFASLEHFLKSRP